MTLRRKLGSLPVWRPVLERLSDPVYLGTYLFASINSLIVVVMMVAVAVYIVLGIPNIDASQLSIGEAFGSGIKISSIGAAVSVFASCLSGGTAVSQIAEYS